MQLDRLLLFPTVTLQRADNSAAYKFAQRFTGTKCKKIKVVRPLLREIIGQADFHTTSCVTNVDVYRDASMPRAEEYGFAKNSLPGCSGDG